MLKKYIFLLLTFLCISDLLADTCAGQLSFASSASGACTPNRYCFYPQNYDAVWSDYEPNPAHPDRVPVQVSYIVWTWGDGSPDSTIRGDQDSNIYNQSNKFSVCHTFPGPGTYTVTTVGTMYLSGVATTVCTSSLVVTIPVSSSLGFTINKTNPTCGNSNGTASVNITGGTATGYSWSNGNTTATATNLSAGTYTVTVNGNSTVTVITPGNGWVNGHQAMDTTRYTSSCPKTDVVTLISPPISISTSATPGNCGASTGSATAAGIGGNGPYTYAWNNNQITATATGLAAGTYTVTVTDASGCSGTSTVNVTNTPPGTASITSVNTKCAGGSDGSATATMAGGTAPFDYLWSNNQTTAAINGLTAATYTVTITDKNNCTSTASATVAQPAPVTLNTTPTDVSCNGGNNGSATATGGGGTPGFTYVWSTPGGATATANNLSAGAYTVTTTDANGCTNSASVTIKEPSPVSGSTTTTPSVCGGVTGSATATGGGGTAPYNYNWSTNETTGTINNLSGATYTVTVKDANNCTTTTTAIVTSTGGVTVSLQSSTPATCIAGGSATTSITGGTAPIIYSWTPSGGNAGTAGNLTAGTYTVVVTDGAGCNSTTSVTITIPPGPTVTTTATDDNCGQGKGTATVIGAGGSGSYSYSWNNNQTSTTINGLKAGTYTVTVTDGNGCSTTTIATVGDKNAPTVATTKKDISCYGAGDGSATATANGGAGGYIYNWTPGGSAASNLTNLSAGTYTISVTDGVGCMATNTAVITEPPQITVTTNTVDANCNKTNGSANATAAGGSGGLSYSWMPGSITTPAISNIGAGAYTLTITDVTGCTTSTTALVSNVGAPAITSTQVDVLCNGGNNGSATINITGGITPYNISWNPSSLGTGATINTLAAGTYNVAVTDANSCVQNYSVTISEPTAVIVTVQPVSTICIGQSATLNATGNGGTPAYTYAWNPGAQTGASVTVNPTATGTYTVAMSDSHNCPTTATVTVNVNPPLNVKATGGTTTCQNTSTTISATGSGGDNNYTYSWQPGNLTGASVAVTPPVGTTTYTVTVYDDCGTPTSTDVTTITVPPVLTPVISLDTAQGCAPLTVIYTNNTPGSKSCNWDFGDGSTDLRNCSTTHIYNKDGVFTVKLTVTDANNCASASTTTTVTVFPKPIAAFSEDPNSTTILTPTINFTDESSQDVAKWDWSFGDATDGTSNKRNTSYAYKDTGKYDVQLIVTNRYGCTDTATDEVVITGDYTFYVPNAFSPNGDNKNETFFPKGFMINPDCYHLMIFDRWGNLIFETHDLNIGWDGRANGGQDIAQQDVYVWKIETCDYRKHKYHYIGHVTLIK